MSFARFNFRQKMQNFDSPARKSAVSFSKRKIVIGGIKIYYLVAVQYNPKKEFNKFSIFEK